MLPKLSVRQKLALLEHFPNPEDIYYTEAFGHLSGISADAEDALRNKDLTDAQKVIKSCADRNIGILTIGDTAYPTRLRNIHEPPLVLYYQGVLPDFESQPVIAVVGTRKASAYGLNNARQFSVQIAACGGLVISGGAYGVDTMALKGALDAEQQTVAVLGCGVDVVYPRTNRELFVRIRENGCLISEYLPGTGPKPWQFPERNRILSGLSNGVLVVEAPEKSGALITARNAFEQGRDVYVIPGNIGVASGAGSNQLLQDYGAAVFSGWDVLKDYAPQYPGVVEQRSVMPPRFRQETPPAMVAQPVDAPRDFLLPDKKDIDNPMRSAYSDLDNGNFQLNDLEKQIVACLDGTPRPVDEVIAQVGLPAAEVLRAFTKLALKGVVVNHPGRLVSARK